MGGLGSLTLAFFALGLCAGSLHIAVGDGLIAVARGAAGRQVRTPLGGIRCVGAGGTLGRGELGVDLSAFADLIGDVAGDQIADLETAHDLDERAEVTANLDRLDVDAAVANECDDVLAVADGDGISGDGNGTLAGDDGSKGGDSVHAIEQATIVVIDLNFREHGASVLVDGVGGARDEAGEDRGGELLKVKIGMLSAANGTGVAFGH